MKEMAIKVITEAIIHSSFDLICIPPVSNRSIANDLIVKNIFCRFNKFENKYSNNKIEEVLMTIDKPLYKFSNLIIFSMKLFLEEFSSIKLKASVEIARQNLSIIHSHQTPLQII